MILLIVSIFYLCVLNIQIADGAGLGDDCKISQNVTGVCKNDCPKNDLVVYPACGEHGYEKLFCCPESPTPATATEHRSNQLCPPLFQISLDITCIYKNQPVSCEHPLKSGTTAKLKCKDSYHLNYFLYHQIHCIEGKWDNELFNCEPKCGEISVGRPQMVNAKMAITGQFPWHIGIYIRSDFSENSVHSYICGGSIISERLTLTAAHCFSQENPSYYRVAAGKFYSDWLDDRDEDAQKRNIIKIFVAEKYKGAVNSYSSDIAVLLIDGHFDFSNIVLPVCIDYDGKYFQQINESKSGDVPGWGLTSPEGFKPSETLLFNTLPLIDFEECIKSVPNDFRKHVTIDKICAGYKNGTSICAGDSGGGLVLPIQEQPAKTRYYIFGLVSTSPVSSNKVLQCTPYEYSTFTYVEIFKDWINNTKFEYSSWTTSDFGCLLPNHPQYGYYEVENAKKYNLKTSVGEVVPQFTTLKYSCSDNYRLTENIEIICKNKQWNNNHTLPECLNSCTPLTAPQMDLKCKYERVDIPCNETVPHGTHASFNCKESGYEPEDFTLDKNIFCHGGQWTSVVPKCIQICGLKEPSNHLPTSSSLVAGNYPWHVGVYLKYGNEYQLRASGILISPVLVMIYGNFELMRYKEIIVAAGKVNKILDNTGEPHEQRSGIFHMITRPFSRSEFMLVYVLDTKFRMTPYVRPICMETKKICEHDDVTSEEISFWASQNEILSGTNVDISGHCKNNYRYQKLPNMEFANAIVMYRRKRWNELRYFTNSLMYLYTGEERPNRYLFTSDDLNWISSIIIKYSDLYSYTSVVCTVPTLPPNLYCNSKFIRPNHTVAIGTKIDFVCKGGLTLAGSKSISCTNDGWHYKYGHPQCVLCGAGVYKINTVHDQLTPANRNDFPWHATLYDIQGTRGTEYICGGTIISPNIILTDRNCFLFGIADGVTRYTVTAGNFYHKWQHKSDKTVQISEIETIFEDITTNIALVVLKTPFNITRSVSPVCLDSNKIITQSMHRSNSEILPGWYVEAEDKLQFLPLNWSSFMKSYTNDDNESYKMYKHEFDGYEIRMTGGGLVLPVPTELGTQYFLQGVFKEVESKVLIFSDVGPSINWMNDLISRYKLE